MRIKKKGIAGRAHTFLFIRSALSGYAKIRPPDHIEIHPNALATELSRMISTKIGAI